jgi:hypothetical protein
MQIDYCFTSRNVFTAETFPMIDRETFCGSGAKRFLSSFKEQ